MTPYPVTPLPAFFKTVLANEIRGHAPDTLHIAAPLTVDQYEKISIFVSLLDNGEGVRGVSEQIHIDCPDSGIAPIEISFHTDDIAAIVVENVHFPKVGVFRLRGKFKGEIFYSNPIVCKERHVEKIMWGDPHVHTILGDCHPDKCRSLHFAYIAGRYLTGLQWMACTDHVSNGRCDKVRWKEQVLASNAHNDPGKFVTLPAYEASLQGGKGGDNNVYMKSWPQYFIDQYEDGSILSLTDMLATEHDEDFFFVAPHHTSRKIKHGEIGFEIYPGEQRMPLFEISSCWGTSEYRGNNNPLQTIHTGPCFAQDLLNNGLPLGFIGGTDSHTSNPFHISPLSHTSHFPGGTGVMVSSLDRSSLIDSMRKRHCYAGSKYRTYLNFSVTGTRMGDRAKMSSLKRPTIRVSAAGKSDIISIDIVSNGQNIMSIPGTGWAMMDLEVTTENNRHYLKSPLFGEFSYYYARVQYIDGSMAWSSPVWLTKEE